MADPRENTVINLGLNVDRMRANPELLRIGGDSAIRFSGEAPLRTVEPFRCRYAPLPDVTAEELARIVPFLLAAVTPPYRVERAQWEALGAAKRHLPEVRDDAL